MGKSTCNVNPGMPLTASEVAAIKATDKRQNKSCVDSLVLVVEPISKGGGKSFMGVTRFPPRSPKHGGKRVEVRIGPYGKGVGKWTLKQARDEWDRIRAWSKEHNRDPRELKKEEKATPLKSRKVQRLRRCVSPIAPLPRTKPSVNTGASSGVRHCLVLVAIYPSLTSDGTTSSKEEGAGGKW